MARQNLSVIEVTDIYGNAADQLVADADFTSVVYTEEEVKDDKGRPSKHIRTTYYDADNNVVRELYDGVEVERTETEPAEPEV